MTWESNPEVAERLAQAIEQDDVQLFKQLLSQHPTCTRTESGSNIALWLASQMGRVELVKILLELGVDPNEPDITEQPSGAIRAAATEGHFQVVRLLLERGGKLGDIISPAMNGHLDIVKLLVKHGADPHAVISGMNALMHAEMYGHTEVANYLRSLDVKDVRETTPPDYRASHRQLREIMAEHYGPLAQWQSEDSGEPTITICASKAARTTGVKAIFTLGLSDRDLECGSELLITTELMLLLPAQWRLSKSTWPVVWMHKIARHAIDAKQWPDERAAVFMNGDPPEPFADDTKLSGWLCLLKEGAQYQMPDHRWIEVRLMVPIYREEQRLIESDGYAELLNRFEDKRIPQSIDLKRTNLAKLRGKLSTKGKK